MIKLDRAGIEGCVPHAGAMCLLDAVVAWDAARITCRAPAPDAAHPLAREGEVHAAIAAEYAAQASAVHGALIEPQSAPRAGMLAKLSEFDLHGAVIAADGGPLEIRAELLTRSTQACAYAFEVRNAGQGAIASGRVMVAFVPPGGAS